MSLTDEILKQINDYNMESFDAEINVIKAHMEACMRDITIEKECAKCGIIMEGDIIPQRDGEHILKYILLFLPRLIINILRKFSRWLSGNPEIMTTEELKELSRKREAEIIKARKDVLIDQFRAAVVKAANQDIKKGYPNALCSVFVNKDGVYGCKIGFHLDKVSGRYSDFVNYFDKYVNVFERLNQSEDLVIDDEHNQDIIDFEKELSIISTSDNVSDITDEYYSETVDIKYAKFFKKDCEDGAIASCQKKIDYLMNQLIDMYHNMDKNQSISQSNLRFATRYFESIKAVFNSFEKFHTSFKTTFEAILKAYGTYIPDRIKNTYKNENAYDDIAKDTWGGIMKERDFDKPKYVETKEK